MKTKQKICIHTSVFVSFSLRFHPSTLMRFWKRSSKREQDAYVTSAQTMVTFVLCCRKYCFKRLTFTSFFFNLVTRFLFDSCFESGVGVLAGKNASSWRQRFWKAPFSCNHIKTYRCVFKCLRIQKRFQMSPFPKTKASVFDRCSMVARWKRIENDAFSNEKRMKTH